MSTILLALRVLVSLAVVVGLLWYVQRRTNRWTAKRKTPSAVSLIARKSLGSKTNLVVIEVEGTRFVLGVSEHSVSVLQSAPADAAAEVPVAGRRPGTASGARPAPASDPGSASRPERELVLDARSERELVPDGPSERELVLGARATPSLVPDPEPAPRFADVLARESDRSADDADPQPERRQQQGSHSLPRPDFTGFSGSIVSLETWKQAARALRGPRWP